MRGQKQNTRRATDKKRRSSRAVRNKNAPPRTAQEYFAKPERFQDQWNRVVHVISKLRADGVSLKQASREFGVDPRTVLKLGKSALRKRTSGRYAAKTSDRLLRVLAVPTHEGTREIALRDSRQASMLGQYWDAVQRYLQTGEALALQKFRGKRITAANRLRVPLLTDLDQLSRLGNAGVLSFESIYPK
jgi:hypothetical protein